MNNLDIIYKESSNPAEYAQKYFRYLSSVFEKIDNSAIESFINLLLDARQSGRQIFFIGNGGSAATASHFSNDIGIGTRTTDLPFKTISLTDNVAILTALGNDEGYHKIFQKQLELYLKPKDIVVAISASGNSPSIIDALEYAKSKDAVIVGLSGFDGGKLKQLSDIALHVPTPKGEYGPVEDLHMIFDHLVGTYLYRAVHQPK